MVHLEKRKKTISIIIIGTIIYLGLSLFIYNIIFTPQLNKLTGNAITSVNVTKSIPTSCNITIYNGENLISFHCISGLFPLDFVLENITTDKYNSIFEYNQNDVNDPWKSYNPTLPNYIIQDLSMIKEDKGYWIIANKNSSINFEGILNSHQSTQLYQGWNLVGYPRIINTTPSDAFSSLNGKYDFVIQYKKILDTWYYYSPSDPASTLTLIEPDYGYWIHLNQDAQWTYPN